MSLALAVVTPINAALGVLPMSGTPTETFLDQAQEMLLAQIQSFQPAVLIVLGAGLVIGFGVFGYFWLTKKAKKAVS